MLISVVIPAYNEERTIATLLQRVLDARFEPHKWEIIVIDDCSKDKTAELVAKFEPQVKLVRQERNQGKGAAIRKGFTTATGDVVIVQDADLEYNPADYRSLLQPIVDDVGDVVYGSRFDGGKTHRVLYFWHYVANRSLTLFSNMTSNLNLSDMETGYKVMRREFLNKITLVENGFGIEPEITVKLARTKARFCQVGISYYGRTYEEGKKITWVHGIEALWCIFKYGVLLRGF
jgi:glycosyltransferase involved in cell wall biosynthesis